MDKECLILSLCKMQDTQNKRERLQLRGWSLCAIDPRATVVYEGVNKQRTQIFNDEDGSPGDLSAYREWSVMSFVK